MKVTIRDIDNAREVLGKIANMDWPIKTSYTISKLIQKLNEEYNAIENLRTQLVQKYGEADENNIRVVPGSDNYFQFMKEWEEFRDTEVEIVSDKIEIDINSGLQLKPIDMINIDKFVTFLGLPE